MLNKNSKKRRKRISIIRTIIFKLKVIYKNIIYSTIVPRRIERKLNINFSKILAQSRRKPNFPANKEVKIQQGKIDKK